MLGQNLRDMDMGAGTGWLSAHLSRFDNVEKIYTLDSSRFFFSVMVPATIEKMKGNSEKIKLIKGLFTSILMGDGSMDVIVASSSLHHAENLLETLVEIHRVLKKNGILVILNETPEARMQYFMNTVRHFKGMCKNVFFMNYDSRPTYISASCIHHAPHLGDKSYALWYWKEALVRAKFPNVTIQVTKMRTQKGDVKGEFLTHFICRKG